MKTVLPIFEFYISSMYHLLCSVFDIKYLPRLLYQ